MPSLSLSSGVSKGRDTKRSQTLIHEPFTHESSHDEWYSVGDNTLGGAGISHNAGGYIIYQNICY